MSPSQAVSVERVIGILHEHGLRVTQERRALLSVLVDAERPLNLGELQKGASDLGESPDYATVFRLMAQLEELNLAQKVPIGRERSYYQLARRDGFSEHLVCTECGEVKVLEMPSPVRRAQKKIAAEYGFTVCRHTLAFFGVCARCADA